MRTDKPQIQRRAIKRQPSEKNLFNAAELNVHYMGLRTFLGRQLSGNDRIVYNLIVARANVVQHSFTFSADLCALAMSESLQVWQVKDALIALQERQVIELGYIDDTHLRVTIFDMRGLANSNKKLQK